MKIVLSFAVLLLLVSCSSAPVEVAEKEPTPPPQPITGRQALQSTFVTARGWAADAEPVRIRNYNLLDVPSEDGKAGAWEVTYASAAMRAVRSFTWSAVEAQGLKKGSWGGSQGSYSPGSSRDVPFQPSVLGVDTPDVLMVALEHAKSYLEGEGEKPQITFLLEQSPRHPQLSWRVMWGDSPSKAQYSVYVDAANGEFLGL